MAWQQAVPSGYNHLLMSLSSRKEGQQGLYVILDPSVCPGRPLRDVLTQSSEAGARIFQYRYKAASMTEAYADALALRKIAAELGVTFIVNDRCDLALAINADGVHLGQEDLPYLDARKVMGEDKIIGLSTHNEHHVREAQRLQPDYIGFGPIFKPGSKVDHEPVVGIEGLRSIRSLTTLPIFAIGGIQVEQAKEVMRAGANGVAVISAILKAPDIRQATRNFIAQLS